MLTMASTSSAFRSLPSAASGEAHSHRTALSSALHAPRVGRSTDLGRGRGPDRRMSPGSFGTLASRLERLGVQGIHRLQAYADLDEIDALLNDDGTSADASMRVGDASETSPAFGMLKGALAGAKVERAPDQSPMDSMDGIDGFLNSSWSEEASTGKGRARRPSQ